MTGHRESGSSEEIEVWVTPQNPHRRVRIKKADLPYCECIEVRLQRSGMFKKSERGVVAGIAARPELARQWLEGQQPPGIHYLSSPDAAGYKLAAMDAIQDGVAYQSEVIQQRLAEQGGSDSD